MPFWMSQRLNHLHSYIPRPTDMNSGFYRQLKALPLELRETVYTYVFIDAFSAGNLEIFDTFRCAVIARDRHSTSSGARPLPILPGLCCVNRQLFQESLPVFLRLCRVEIDGRGPTNAFCKLLHLVPANRAYASIQNLRVWLPPLDALDRLVMEGNGAPTHAMHLIKLCGSSLRRLTIDITIGCFAEKTGSGWRIPDAEKVVKKFDFTPLSCCTNLEEVYMRFGWTREKVERRFAALVAKIHKDLAKMLLTSVRQSGSNPAWRFSSQGYDQQASPSDWSMHEEADGYVGWGFHIGGALDGGSIKGDIGWGLHKGGHRTEVL